MRRSYLIAGVMTLAIAGWLGAGYPYGAPEDTAKPAAKKTEKADEMTVAVKDIAARTVQQSVVAQGQVEPNRVVTLHSETTGRVEALPATEGGPVKAGDVIAQLEMNDREARLKQAQAAVDTQKRAFEAAEKLGNKGFGSERNRDDRMSALRTAEAELEKIRIEIGHTKIRAPFDGILNNVAVEIGNYLASDKEVATIVDNDPLIVSVQVGQQHIGQFGVGDKATVKLATGKEREGKIRYIAAMADTGTRTFRVEITIDNPDSAIPAGLSAEAHIPTKQVKGHFLSPALLSLDDKGALGVKTVNGDGKVAFNPVDIVQSSNDGVWVTGLPDAARVITQGQGFVQAGEKVAVAPAGGSTLTGALPEKAGPDAAKPQLDVSAQVQDSKTLEEARR